MKIELSELSDQEQKLIEEFRSRVKNAIKKDMYEDILLFSRFLKARDFDVDEAEKMLRKHLIWRKLFQIDTIMEDFKPNEYFLRYIEPSIIGFDKEESLLLYVPIGKYDLREHLKCTTLSNHKKHIVWFGEKMYTYAKNEYEQSGRSCKNATLIIDLDELTFEKATNAASVEIVLFMADIFQNNYPEMVKALYVINAPAYYIIVFSLVKAIMSSVMIRKFHIFSRSGWKEELLQSIDADVLPAFLGGNKTDTDGDPLCKSFVCHGGTVNSIYFLTDDERYLKDKSRVSKFIIPNKGKKEICVDVKEMGSLIAWEFYTKSNNIGFGLFYERDEQLQEVIPIERYSTADGAEKNSYKVRTIGKYVIIFDNTYSWLTSKEVEYCIEVLPNHDV